MKYNFFNISVEVEDIKLQIISKQFEDTLNEWDVLGNYCRVYTRYLMLYGVIQALFSVLTTMEVLTKEQSEQLNEILNSKHNIYYQEEDIEEETE